MLCAVTTGLRRARVFRASAWHRTRWLRGNPHGDELVYRSSPELQHSFARTRARSKQRCRCGAVTSCACSTRRRTERGRARTDRSTMQETARCWAALVAQAAYECRCKSYKLGSGTRAWYGCRVSGVCGTKHEPGKLSVACVAAFDGLKHKVVRLDGP